MNETKNSDMGLIKRMYSDADIIERLKSNLECIISDADRVIRVLEGKRSQAESTLAYLKSMQEAKRD
jgi:hypothetical protein